MSVYAVGAVVLLVVCGALAITDAERGASGANIVGLTDGLWWAFVTITTVGYGDMSPVTTTGRLVAACLMVGGIGLLGTVSGMLASWMVDQINTPQVHQNSDAGLARLADLHTQGLLSVEEFTAAKARLLGLSATRTTDPAPPSADDA